MVSYICSPFATPICCFVGHLGHSKGNSVLKTKSELSLFPCLLLFHSLVRMIQSNSLVFFSGWKVNSAYQAVWMENCYTQVLWNLKIPRTFITKLILRCEPFDVSRKCLMDCGAVRNGNGINAIIFLTPHRKE